MSERRVLVTPVVPIEAVDSGKVEAPAPDAPTVPQKSSLERAVEQETLRQASKKPEAPVKPQR